MSQMKSSAAKIMVVLLLAALSGCHSSGKAVTEDETDALRRQGYARAPQITEVTQEGVSFVVSGIATPDGRVQFIYAGSNVGLNADSKGRFRVALPSGPAGGLYDLMVEDRGRYMHAEGRLFVPAGSPDKAVVLRPGGASQPLSATKNVLAVVDYDSAGGVAVAGRVEAGQTVNFVADGVTIGRTQSDDTGRYHLTAQIAAPTAVPVQIDAAVEAGSDQQKRPIMVSLPAGNDQITKLTDGWRIDWVLPGGGVQTTLVF